LRSYPSFEKDIARYRRTNGIYRPWGVLTHTYPQRVAASLGLRRMGSRSDVRDL